MHMNQTGFQGGRRWGAFSTMGAERERLKESLKRLLNHSGLQISTCHPLISRYDTAEGHSPKPKASPPRQGQLESREVLGQSWQCGK